MIPQQYVPNIPQQGILSPISYPQPPTQLDTCPSELSKCTSAVMEFHNAQRDFRQTKEKGSKYLKWFAWIGVILIIILIICAISSVIVVYYTGMSIFGKKCPEPEKYKNIRKYRKYRYY